MQEVVSDYPFLYAFLVVKMHVCVFWFKIAELCLTIEKFSTILGYDPCRNLWWFL